MAHDNKSLGTFRLDGIPPAPRGMPQIEVTFDIDANGILHVSAKDKGTSKEQRISITGSSGLSQDEIEKAKRDAEVHADADRQRKDLAETRNLGDNLAYQIEKQLADLGDKIAADQRKPVEDALSRLKEALKGEDVASIRSATDALQKAFQPVAAGLYQQTEPSSGAASSTASSGAGAQATSEPRQAKGNVVDADFEVVDEDKK
jgi:molecular chaperone DnaK